MNQCAIVPVGEVDLVNGNVPAHQEPLGLLAVEHAALVVLDHTAMHAGRWDHHRLVLRRHIVYPNDRRGFHSRVSGAVGLGDVWGGWAASSEMKGTVCGSTGPVTTCSRLALALRIVSLGLVLS